MQASPVTRRHFLARTGAAVAVAKAWPGMLSPAAAADSPGQGGIRLGAPLFTKTETPDDFARAHRQLGYRAAYCPGVSLKDSGRIRAYADACQREDVVIAEVGRWCNLLEADTERRRKNLELVTDGLALAEAIGARCCVNIAGSFNEKIWYGPHPHNLSPRFFDAVVENARKIIDAVKPQRAKFCYEMMGWALPDSPEAYLKMIKAVDRPAFGVHLDPCNLINSPARYYNNTALLNECFDTLGRWITSCHAKDLTWDVEMNVHFREVGAGQGTLDYETLLRRLAQLPQQPPLMIEHLAKAEEYAAAAKHIVAVGTKLGIGF